MNIWKSVIVVTFACVFLVAGMSTAAEDDQKWPELKIQGIMGSGKSGGAMINNKLLKIGKSTMEVKLVAVASKGAYLTFNKETRFVRVGRTPQEGNVVPESEVPGNKKTEKTSK